MSNGKNLSLGETVWYDDANGRATKCVVDAIESDRVWVRILGTVGASMKGRAYFENRELDLLRSTKETSSQHPVCKKCDRFLAEGIEEWDDSMDLLCFGETDLKCGALNPKLEK